MVGILLLTGVCLADEAEFGKRFEDVTLRVDYFHSGTRGEESFSLGEVSEEGPWPGSRERLVDTLNLGEHLARVFDRRTGELIWSRGFCTMFAEWQTTAEAGQGVRRTFHETIRFPRPKAPVLLTISRRDRKMDWKELWSAVIDPASTEIVKEPPVARPAVTTILESGPPAGRVDLLILGDGYAEADLERFREDARHFAEALFATSPFKERRADFNVRALEVVSLDSGIDRPSKGVWKRNALGTRYDTFGTPRYVLTDRNRELRDLAGTAPYDFLHILLNDDAYGGGGIYQQFATCFAKPVGPGQEWERDYVFVHEFGHSFAGLGDEYYASSTAYEEFYPAGVEPWEPNLTRLPGGKPKWSALVSPGVPLPTPWDQEGYDALEAERQKLPRGAADYYEKRQPIMERLARHVTETKYAGRVGAFEGAGYSAKGLFRPSSDCRMFSLTLRPFDPVCSAAIEAMIAHYAAR